MSTKNSEVLIRAKEILNTPGTWIRYRMYDLGRIPASDPRSWEQPDEACNIAAASDLAVNHKRGQHCLLGAIHVASSELSTSANETCDLLHNIAPQVAIHHGKPLDMGKRKQYKRNRHHNAAWFNNTADSLDEINDLLCEGIKQAVEKETTDE